MPHHPSDPLRDRHADALAALASGADDVTPPPEDAEVDAPEYDRGGVPPAPTAAAPAPGAATAAFARLRAREPGHVRFARTTIPVALAMAAALPMLALAWFLLPRTSALKVGGPAVGVGLVVVGAAFAGLAVPMIRLVARHYAHNPR